MRRRVVLSADYAVHPTLLAIVGVVVVVEDGFELAELAAHSHGGISRLDGL